MMKKILRGALAAANGLGRILELVIDTAAILVSFRWVVRVKPFSKSLYAPFTAEDTASQTTSSVSESEGVRYILPSGVLRD